MGLNLSEIYNDFRRNCSKIYNIILEEKNDMNYNMLEYYISIILI